MKSLIKNIKNKATKTKEVLGRAKDFPKGYTLGSYLTPSMYESMIMGVEATSLSPICAIIGTIATRGNIPKGLVAGTIPQALTYVYFRGKELFGKNKRSFIDSKMSVVGDHSWEEENQ